jgi:hypothetical protein
MKKKVNKIILNNKIYKIYKIYKINKFKKQVIKFKILILN